MKALFGALAVAVLGAAVVLSTSACSTESFCFKDCEGQTLGTGGQNGRLDGGNAGVINIGGQDSGNVLHIGTGGGNNGCQAAEIPCNNVDDNCNGQVDENTDFTDPAQCGTCANNCRSLPNVDESSVTCTPPPTSQLGQTAGTCVFKCAQDYYDLDPKQPGCEYYCQKTSDIDKDNGGVCGVDDDCDGQIDEDLDFCNDPKNCGGCGVNGNNCVFANATGKCVADNGATKCTTANTHCQIDTCDPGWWDADGNAANGCEYQCTQTNGGKEICDGLDNDCDNLIDNEDPDLEASVGQSCVGSTVGECAKYQGKEKCINTSTGPAVVCCDVDSDNVTSQSTDLSQPKTGVRNGVCIGTNGPHVLHPGDNPELCNGLDDNCNNQIDESPIDVGQKCGSSVGACQLGTTQCDLTTHTPVCVGSTPPTVDSSNNRIDPCNGVDDDCDGVPDGTVVDSSGATPKACTSNKDCASGALCLQSASGMTCVLPKVCTSNADCASLAGTSCMPTISGKVCALPAPGSGQPCDVPTTPPCVNSAGTVVDCSTTGATPVSQPCKAGTTICAGKLICNGSVKPVAGAKDVCGQDMNCDGRLDNQPNLLTDVHNCGSCGNDCFALGAHANWTCSQGTCKVGTTPCLPGYINCDSKPDCEVQCTPSGAEVCNGFDDDCNCKIDDNITTKPSPVQVCGVSAGATDPKCTTGVTVACTSGAWACTFPTGVCTTGTCSTSPDPCDGVDNNCNGVADESFKSPFRTTKYLGQPCFSDDGLPPPGQGACRGSGTYVCNSAGTDTVCNATFQAQNKQPEACDGIDNDCDGVVDEAYNNATGAADGSFVKPAVVSIGTNKWIFKYEASRPNAGTANPGSGNGYFTSAPAGTTLDKTVACSVQNRIPWFNVTPQEAAQTCANRGGQLCGLADWQTACHTTAGTPCTWGYSTACTTAANYASTGGPFCNLGGFDFDPTTTVNDDGLLVTGSSMLKQCSATWSTNGVFDITGNLREITVNGAAYALMGGAYNTSSDSGATCDFTFYSVDQNFKFYDTGFRCCFSTNPSP